MAWRFSPSKYKNTTPRAPKKEEILYDVPVGNALSANNGIQCSATHMAFALDGEGGKLGVLTIDARGRRQRSEMKIVCAHSDPINDFLFFPFDPSLLATCSRDEKVKLWRCGEAEDYGAVSEPDALVDTGLGYSLECMAAHRTAAQILAIATNASIVIADVAKGETAVEFDYTFEDRVDCLNWSPDGKLLVASGDKGRKGMLFDPRSSKAVAGSFDLHTGVGRESRVVFVDANKVVSSGFAANRVQEVLVLDMRKPGTVLYGQEYASSTGVLLPLYDDDTKLLFLAGKGTNKLIITEVQDRAPQISHVYDFGMRDQTLGACLGSKLTLDVMSGEVARVFQLSKNAITPVPSIVPRRSYRDFHRDLFPDTVGFTAGCTSAEWLKGSDAMPPMISLDPAKKQLPPGISPTGADSGSESSQQRTQSRLSRMSSTGEALDIENAQEEGDSAEKENKRKPTPPLVRGETLLEERPAPPTERRAAKDVTNRGAEKAKAIAITGVVSKFRHVETAPGGTNGTFYNIRNVNTRLPLESNGFCVSSLYAAIPLAGQAGIIQIVDLSDIRKLPDGVIDGLENCMPMTDLVWNPFDPTRLACALDNGEINFWAVDAESSFSDLEPEDVLKVTDEKIISIRFNPAASGIIAVAASDQSLSVWNIATKECLWQCKPHKNSVCLSFAWSSDGRRLASVGRDMNVCVLQPFKADPVLASSKRPVLDSPRAARIVFACEDTCLIVTHFTKTSQRLVSLLDTKTVQILTSNPVDVSSQPLIPHYDYDTSVVFLTAKGDRQIQMFEASPVAPFLLPLAPGTFPSNHQALGLHQKIDCDVRSVEIMKGWRLTEKTMERLSFKVPRVKKDAFQTDLFPHALVTWMPAMTAAEWCSGCERQPFVTDLCPEGMQRSSPVAAPVRKAKPVVHETEAEAPPRLRHVNTREDMKRVEQDWSQKIGVDRTLEQDKMEGVADEEWAEREADKEEERKKEKAREEEMKKKEKEEEERRIAVEKEKEAKRIAMEKEEEAKRIAEEREEEARKIAMEKEEEEKRLAMEQEEEEEPMVEEEVEEAPAEAEKEEEPPVEEARDEEEPAEAEKEDEPPVEEEQMDEPPVEEEKIEEPLVEEEEEKEPPVEVGNEDPPVEEDKVEEEEVVVEEEEREQEEA